MSQVSPTETNYLLNELLREVSRSFYLTLKFLPEPIRAQIGLAYLLARATDTVADTEIVPVEARLQTLTQLRDAILLERPQPDFSRYANSQTASERTLLQKLPAALQLLNQAHPGDQARIRKVLEVICGGQELDLVRFRSGSPEAPVALQSAEDLDDYTWRVAGCVGEFWTDMCLAWLDPLPAVPREQLVADGIRFGKGLQLVNVLRDIPADLAKGRCYLPETDLLSAGLRPRDLTSPSTYGRLKPLYELWLRRAEDHLQAGWRYTTSLPRAWFRVRLACAWPVLIGQDTVRKLRVGNVLDPSQRIKTSRREVKGILLRTVLMHPFPAAWNRLGSAR